MPTLLDVLTGNRETLAEELWRKCGGPGSRRPGPCPGPKKPEPMDPGGLPADAPAAPEARAATTGLGVDPKTKIDLDKLSADSYKKLFDAANLQYGNLAYDLVGNKGLIAEHIDKMFGDMQGSLDGGLADLQKGIKKAYGSKGLKSQAWKDFQGKFSNAISGQKDTFKSWETQGTSDWPSSFNDPSHINGSETGSLATDANTFIANHASDWFPNFEQVHSEFANGAKSLLAGFKPVKPPKPPKNPAGM